MSFTFKSGVRVCEYPQVIVGMNILFARQIAKKSFATTDDNTEVLTRTD